MPSPLVCSTPSHRCLSHSTHCFYHSTYHLAHLAQCCQSMSIMSSLSLPTCHPIYVVPIIGISALILILPLSSPLSTLRPIQLSAQVPLSCLLLSLPITLSSWPSTFSQLFQFDLAVLLSSTISPGVNYKLKDTYHQQDPLWSTLPRLTSDPPLTACRPPLTCRTHNKGFSTPTLGWG